MSRIHSMIQKKKFVNYEEIRKRLALEKCIDGIHFDNDDWNCAILLLENGGDVNVESRSGRTLLSIACGKGNYEMVQNLCEKYSAKFDEYNILYCFDNRCKRNIDERTKIAEFLIRKCDIDKFLKVFYNKWYQRILKIDDYVYKKVMDMVVNEEKRRKQENIRNVLLIGYRKRPKLHQDELRNVASFF